MADDGFSSNDLDEGEVSSIANDAIQRLEQSVAALQELTEDDKEKFRENVRKRIAEKLAAGLDSLHSEMRWAVMFNIVSWLLMVLIVIVVVFFGYKLYKSLKDKERKKDEKRRLKQQKKKK